MSSTGFSEPAHQASLHQLAEILRSAVDAIISIDGLGLIESVNPATKKLFGYSAEELIGQNVRILMPEPYRGDHDNYIRQYRHTGKRKIIGIGREVTGQRKDGSTFPMHLSVSEYEVDGKRHFAGIVHDLSAQKQAEAESLRQKTLFEAIVNDAPQAIVLADTARRIFLINPAVTSIFGYVPDELIAERLRVLYGSDEDYERVWQSVNGNGKPLKVNCRRKNGELFPAEVIAPIVRDRNQQTLGSMRLIRDLTQEVRQEEALRRSQRMDALGQLTGGIAHDFNNLLTVIIGNLELAEEKFEGVGASGFIRRANDAAQMGARLTGRLLSFSRQRKLEPAVSPAMRSAELKGCQQDRHLEILELAELVRPTAGR